MKYAVVEIAGKQYLVSPGMKIKTERLPSQKEGTVKFKDVLLVSDGQNMKVGSPLVSGAEVSGELLAEKRAKKVIGARYKPKTRVHTKRGHRQYYSEILIKEIKL